MPHGTVSGYLPVDGGRIYYEIAGMGPHLIFIHGYSLDRRMWDDQWDYFRGSHTCVRFDIRAYGRSPSPTGPWGAHDDVMLLMAHLGIDRAILCGLSLGGQIALDVAVTYPHAARALVLLDAAAGGYNGWSTAFTASMQRLKVIAGEQGVDAAKAAWLAGPLLDAAREQPEVIARIERMIGEYSGWDWLNDGQFIVPDVPAFERLEDIRAPTLVIAGDRDHEDFRRLAEFLGERIRGARYEVIPGAGHISSMEAPDLVNPRIASFLASL